MDRDYIRFKCLYYEYYKRYYFTWISRYSQCEYSTLCVLLEKYSMRMTIASMGSLIKCYNYLLLNTEYFWIL